METKMTPLEFEKYIGQLFEKKGYQIDYTPQSGDYGVDIFALKDDEKVAIQAKMYGHSSRKINRKVIMELYGAKAYFDCTKAIIATDGILLDDAIVVAEKLGIEIMYSNNNRLLRKNLPAAATIEENSPETEKEHSFDFIWKTYIMPLKGQVLKGSNNKTNMITDVDWGGIERITSQGNKGHIKIETFKFAYNKLLREGFITRDEINQHDPSRVSSGVVLIMSQIPNIHTTNKPKKLIINKDQL